MGAACTTERPEMVTITEGHAVRCHIPHEEREQLWQTEVQPKL